MKLLISNITVCDLRSAHHGKKCDVFVTNGEIREIRAAGKLKVTGAKTIDGKGLILSPGFCDMRASLGEPGFEHKETLESAARAAAAGGYTRVACLPDTAPVIQSKADIEFIIRKSEKLPVYILPYGAITRNREGKEMNELYDMHLAGAVAFTDGNHTIAQAGVLERALEYSLIFNGLILSHAEDKSISGQGQMHEGATSTLLGLKGIPVLSEELVINRDIELAKYTKAPVHLSHISTKGSVDLIRKAKKQGLPVSCDVAVANLIWTDEVLQDYDSNFKLNPPLRGKADQKALWDGLADGTIDCIVSDHKPQDVEHKDLEFEYASTGMIQLQTALSLLLTHAPKSIDTAKIIAALTTHPRRILKQPEVRIEEGLPAELTLYSPAMKWEFTEADNFSKSRNTPVLKSKLSGRVVATINKDQLYQHT